MKTIVKDEKRVNRRDFLMVASLASLASLFGQAGMALFNFFKPRSRPGSFGTRVNAGQVEEFKPGTVSHISKGRFYITRLEDGGFLALWQRCTHLGCTVPWRGEEGQFHCPCHSSVFTPLGEVVSGPAPRPMDLFQIEIVEAAIVVDTSRPIQRERFDPSQVTHA
jgi:cytochrome b6-f complex iron-sulfur subunit